MLLSLALTAQLLSAVQSEDSAAQIDRIPPAVESTPAPAPAVEPAAAAAPEKGATLAAGPTTRRKSTSFLITTAAIGAGALTSYLALVLGVALNFSKGGLSDPLDTNDILLLMVLPAATAAAVTWFVGLLDWSQRGVFSSALWAVLGAGAGELLGLGAGLLIGRALYPDDAGGRGLVMVGIAPAFAVLGAVILMELFKPGEEVDAYASISVARAQGGGLVFGPAFGGKF